MTIICNFFGGPGAGKSTTRAGVFHKLKLDGYNVEESPEFAKELTWEKRQIALDCQPYMFGEQLFRTKRLMGQVEAIITDSPMLLALIYGDEPPSFHQYVLEKFHQFNMLNFYLQRVKDYNPAGRNQTFEGAKAIDDKTLQMLLLNNISFITATGDSNGVDYVYSTIKHELDKQRGTK